MNITSTTSTQTMNRLTFAEGCPLSGSMQKIYELVQKIKNAIVSFFQWICPCLFKNGEEVETVSTKVETSQSTELSDSVVVVEPHTPPRGQKVHGDGSAPFFSRGIKVKDSSPEETQEPVETQEGGTTSLPVADPDHSDSSSGGFSPFTEVDFNAAPSTPNVSYPNGQSDEAAARVSDIHLPPASPSTSSNAAMSHSAGNLGTSLLASGPSEGLDGSHLTTTDVGGSDSSSTAPLLLRSSSPTDGQKNDKVSDGGGEGLEEHHVVSDEDHNLSSAHSSSTQPSDDDVEDKTKPDSTKVSPPNTKENHRKKKKK